MGFFLGIFDSDTIEAALGRQGSSADRHIGKVSPNSTNGLHLRQDWAKMVDAFSWRVRPHVTREVSG